MFSILSRSELILRAKIENMISPDYVLYYIPNKSTEILGNFEHFGNFFDIREFWKMLHFFGDFQIIISKVGGKLRR